MTVCLRYPGHGLPHDWKKPQNIGPGNQPLNACHPGKSIAHHTKNKIHASSVKAIALFAVNQMSGFNTFTVNGIRKRFGLKSYHHALDRDNSFTFSMDNPVICAIC